MAVGDIKEMKAYPFSQDKNIYQHKLMFRAEKWLHNLKQLLKK